MRLLARHPQRQALGEKWKRGPQQRPEGHGVAAQSLLTDELISDDEFSDRRQRKKEDTNFDSTGVGEETNHGTSH